MIVEPELVAAFLFVTFAPVMGFYLYAHVQAYKYKHGRGANQCSQESTSGPP